MNKIFGIIAFFISIICVLACAINVFISIDTYGKNKERIQELEKRVVVLENELSTALGYDITDEEAGDTSGQYDISSFTKIKPTELTTLSQGKKIVVWIGRQGCSYCSLYAPTIKSVTKDLGIKAYYIDLAQLVEFNVPQPYVSDEEEYGILVNLKGDGEWDGYAAEYVGGTPLTLIIRDNKVVGGLSGYTDSVANILNVFDKAGVKKN